MDEWYGEMKKIVEKMKHGDDFTAKDISDSDKLYMQMIYTMRQYEYEIDSDGYFLEAMPTTTFLLEMY